MSRAGVTEREVLKLRPAARATRASDEARPTVDAVAVEEPLEIRVAEDPVAITMRTPGHDSRLAVGFLFAEGIIGSIDDVGSVYHCGQPGSEGYGNAIEVVAAPGTVLDVERTAASRRGTLTTAACGVCGRRTIDDLLARCRPLDDPSTVSPRQLEEAMTRLAEHQQVFAQTGGTHAAIVVNSSGAVLAAFEDVGRHNAVDKAVGELLYRKLVGVADGGPLILAVSGRASFEIVQKATMARIPVVASVSAASSLAIDLARASRVTLASFVRAGGLNVYSHPERVVSPREG